MNVCYGTSGGPVCLTVQKRMATSPGGCAFARPFRVNTVHLSGRRVRFRSTGGNSGPAVRLLITGASSGLCAPILVRLPPCLDTITAPRGLKEKHANGVGVALSASGLPGLNLAATSICLSHFPKSGMKRRGRVPISTVLLPSFSRVDRRRHLGPPTVRLSTGRLRVKRLGDSRGGTRAVVIGGMKGSGLRVLSLRIFGSTLKIRLGGHILGPNTSAGLGVATFNRGLGGMGNAPHILVVAGSPGGPGVVVGMGMASGG